MSMLVLTIDLLPRGAWGNDLSVTLPKKDWDTLRQACYERALNICSICGNFKEELQAHEVWEFDSAAKTQTLKNIIALCPACHGVKHMRNSERIGYKEQAKAHFIKINRCRPEEFDWHYEDAQKRFDELSKIERWKIIAALDKFGGKGIEVKQRQIPKIINPYDGVDWTKLGRVKVPLHITVIPPQIGLVEVDNYQGTIDVVAYGTNRIEWLLDGEKIKSKYNFGKKLVTQLGVGDLKGSSLLFKLVGDGGETLSREFHLQNIDYLDRGVV